MKVLILSFHFQPDLSAGSFRNTALVEAIQKKLPRGSEITVMTTLPNRYSSFSVDAPKQETSSGLTIHRVALPSHKSGMLDQSKAFVIYARQVHKLVKGNDYDLVYASSSRLMTAALGAWVSQCKQVPLYLDIRDIFVDTIKDVLSRKLAWIIKPIFAFIERWTVKKASKVNLVSGGFLPYFQDRYPHQAFSLFTNGIDKAFIEASPLVEQSSARTIPEVIYAGNMGEGQGLHHIIPNLAKHFEGKLQFKLIGDGGRYKHLVEALQNAGCTNVELVDPVSREELIGFYQSADVLFLHLNDYDAFKKVLPSKVFEYAALGKPIWAGVGGFAAKFIQENIDNAAIFSPCNDKDAVDAFANLQLVTQPRTDFTASFARTEIMKGLADDILLVADPDLR
ncbi:glycosyltransferase WbuB [Salinivibrio sp. MA440]|uniref:glycosyltransferase family 4 protein n=1 Tax=Salinivibrio sp. MA440 TaxID=1909456 RepID=UPI0009893EC3|nr:glycosyltransferase family 4 protein [Salinivibrio sp. MA440]OOF02131.1 glycosyltransferase WbuB [Salinivibrio sp. MA440]